MEFDDVVADGGLKRKPLGSTWDGLNPLLVANIWRVRPQHSGNSTRYVPYTDKSEGSVIKCVITDGTVEQGEAWSSPFEQSGSLFPTLQNLLQSGALDKAINASVLRPFEGRSGLTKLNAQQTFNSATPLKIQATLLFKAFADAKKEVEEPFNQLMQWALPQRLAQDGFLLSRLASLVKDNNGKRLSATDAALQTLMPSETPALVALSYKNRLYNPMVIENISYSLTSPITASGDHAEMQVQVTLCSLTALDARDWRSMRTNVGAL